jgi:hypothetical protein
MPCRADYGHHGATPIISRPGASCLRLSESSVRRLFHVTRQCTRLESGLVMHVPSLAALMQPSPSVHMMEAWPHAQGELCCLVRHHFRATPTPRTSLTGPCRCHPTCQRLITGGVAFPGALLFCVPDGRPPSPSGTGRNESSGSPSYLYRSHQRNAPVKTPGSQVLLSPLFPRMPSALLRVSDRCVSPLLPCQHRPSPQA